MRYLILSDIHGNREALDAVLRDAAGPGGGYDRALCCGDLCDYGPDSDYVIDWARANLAAVIRGNHDRVCAGFGNLDEFTALAQAAALWTMEHLSDRSRTYLRELPEGPRVVDGRLVLVHGSPRDEDEYVTSMMEAAEVFADMEGSDEVELPHFFGHTHVQGGWVHAEGRIQAIARPHDLFSEMCFRLEPGAAYLINVGAVGQPRDGDPRAAYGLFDTDAGEVALRRVPYDYQATEVKIEAAGLPPKLGLRLAAGR